MSESMNPRSEILAKLKESRVALAHAAPYAKARLEERVKLHELELASYHASVAEPAAKTVTHKITKTRHHEEYEKIDDNDDPEDDDDEDSDRDEEEEEDEEELNARRSARRVMIHEKLTAQASFAIRHVMALRGEPEAPVIASARSLIAARDGHAHGLRSVGLGPVRGAELGRRYAAAPSSKTDLRAQLLAPKLPDGALILDNLAELREHAAERARRQGGR
jgi:hypothetical protein